MKRLSVGHLFKLYKRAMDKRMSGLMKGVKEKKEEEECEVALAAVSTVDTLLEQCDFEIEIPIAKIPPLTPFLSQIAASGS